MSKREMSNWGITEEEIETFTSPLEKICDDSEPPHDESLKKSTNESSDAAANAALTPYPIYWHTPYCLDYHGRAAESLDRWSVIKHCNCGQAEPMYFLKGLPYELWAPRAIRNRPPCCFEEAAIHLKDFESIMVQDRHGNVLMTQILEGNVESVARYLPQIKTNEESLMWFLTENIWWLAHEKCEVISVEMDFYGIWISTDYRTDLVLPMVADRKTSLRSYMKILSGVYKHVRFRLFDLDHTDLFSREEIGVTDVVRNSRE